MMLKNNPHPVYPFPSLHLPGGCYHTASGSKGQENSQEPWVVFVSCNTIGWFSSAYKQERTQHTGARGGKECHPLSLPWMPWWWNLWSAEEPRLLFTICQLPSFFYLSINRCCSQLPVIQAIPHPLSCGYSFTLLFPILPITLAHNT